MFSFWLIKIKKFTANIYLNTIRNPTKRSCLRTVNQRLILLVVLEAIISYMASEKVVVNSFVPGEIFQANYFFIIVPNEIFSLQIEKGI